MSNSSLRQWRRLSMVLSMLIAPMVSLEAAVPKSAAKSSNTIRLRPFVQQLLVVHAAVQGHPGTFLFDSGGGLSNITPEFAAAIGGKPWGQTTGYRMTGERLDMPRCDGVAFQLGENKFPPQTVGVFDINKFMPPGTPHLDGTISLDIFADRALTFSYSARTITLLTSASLAQIAPVRRSLPIHIVRDAEGLALTVDLPVTTPDGTAWFEMDSGNTSGTLLVGKHLAGLLKLDAGRKTPQRWTVTVGNGSNFTSEAVVLDLILDGNLGTTFLSRYDVTLDLTHSRAWLSPSSQTIDSSR